MEIKLIDSKPLIKSGSFWGYIGLAIPLVDLLIQSANSLPSALLPLPLQMAIAAISAMFGIYKTKTRSTKIEGVFLSPSR